MGKTTDIQNNGQEWTLDALSQSIRQVHELFAAKAKHAVNLSLTLRNWLIGFYIVEYQLHSADRATYGDKVVFLLAESLKDVSNCSRQELYKYTDFYRAYPQIVGTVSRPLESDTLMAKDEKLAHEQWEVILKLSYSHLSLLTGVESTTARRFYETECIRGCWSVRELKRQIGSLLYERTALSSDKQKTVELSNAKAERDTLALTIRDPYVFDFLGLKAKGDCQ